MTKFNRRNSPDRQYPIFITKGECKSESSDKPTKIQGTCGERPMKCSYSISHQVHRIFSRIDKLYIYK